MALNAWLKRSDKSMGACLQSIEPNQIVAGAQPSGLAHQEVAIYQSPWRVIGKPTGVGQHVAQMTRCLAEAPSVSCRLLATRNDYEAARMYLPGQSAALPVRFLPPSERLLRAALFSGVAAIERWSGEVDWIYCPKEQPVKTRRARLAVTVHDVLAFEPNVPGLHENSRPWTSLRCRLLMHQLLQRADLIATVSQFTRQRMIDLLGLRDEERVVVVGNGVDPCYFALRQPNDAETLAQHRLTADGYLLTVGSLTFRKGGDLLLDIADRTRRQRLPWHFVVTGRRHDAKLLQRFETMRRTSPDLPLRLAGYLPKEEQALLMRNALALLFPSRYEGFGIPVLEAMAAGTPVICSAAAALREVGGPAAAFVESFEVEPWLARIAALSDGDLDQKLLVTAGRLRAAAFTWERCANRLVAAMRAR